MNIKKQVIISIRAKLIRLQEDNNWELRKNLREFEKLRDRQTVLKREKAKLHELIKSLGTLKEHTNVKRGNCS